MIGVIGGRLGRIFLRGEQIQCIAAVGLVQLHQVIPGLVIPFLELDRRTEASHLDAMRAQQIQHRNHRLLVRDDKKKIIGIISPKDIMRAMIGVSNPSQNLKEKLKEAEEQLQTSLHKISEIEKHLEVYRSVFQETPYMIHAADFSGKIIMSNRSEHEALGYKMGELIGQSIYDLYAPQMHAEAKRGLELIKEKGFHHMTYTTLVKKDGTPLRCDIVSSAMRDKDGQFLSTVTVLRPVDSEELLRTLNGIVNDANGPLARYVFNR